MLSKGLKTHTKQHVKAKYKEKKRAKLQNERTMKGEKKQN